MTSIAIIYFGQITNTGICNAAERRVIDLVTGIQQTDHADGLLIAATKTANYAPQLHHGAPAAIFTMPPKQPRAVNRILFWIWSLRQMRKKGVTAAILYNPMADGILFLFLLRLAGITALLEISDIRPTTPTSFFSIKNWVHNINAYLCNKVLPKLAQGRIAISQYLTSIIPAKNTSVVSVIIQPAPPLDRSNIAAHVLSVLDINPQDFVILYTGAFWKDFGVANLLLAFEIFHAKYPNARLVIAGKLVVESTHDDVQALTKMSPARSAVCLTGWISGHNLHMLFARANIGVSPHHDTELFTAGFPTKLAEYASWGIPIVTTSTGDISDIFTHRETAYLLDSSTPEKLATAFDDIARSVDQQRVLSLGSKTLAQTAFHPHAAGEKIVTLVESIS